MREEKRRVGSESTREQGVNRDFVERLRTWRLKAIQFCRHSMAAKMSTFCTFYELYGEGTCNARGEKTSWFRIYTGTPSKPTLPSFPPFPFFLRTLNLEGDSHPFKESGI